MWDKTTCGCKRLHNISAPVVDLNSELDSDSFIAPNQLAAQEAEPGSSSSASSAEAAGGSSQTASATMEAKLDLILKRMDVLGNKNLHLGGSQEVREELSNLP